VVRAAFTTLGCKVNQYETQKILESFAAAGFEVVPFDSPADWYVINSCSVTNDAEAKSRYVARRAKRANPEAKVAVTGCAAQATINRGEPFVEADLVVPNPDKLRTLQYVLNFAGLPVPSNLVSIQVSGGRTRATLKVQDGCDVHCTYCSIPFTRPGMSSRPYEELLAEARAYASAGYQEIVLTGVLIGAYGPETGSGGLGFEEMVEGLARESGVPRVRISSIEMHQVTARLVELISKGFVVPHLHIPLQSGDDGVLEAMGRRYRRSEFISLCKSLPPGITVTTDIMVGFPAETEEAFANTVALAEEVRFLKVHVFRFSPRHGTPAQAYGDPVSPEVKRSRAQRLTEVSDRIGRELVCGAVGKTLRVVFEAKPGKDGLLTGIADNWMTVRAVGAPNYLRTLQWVRAQEEAGGELFGEVVARPLFVVV
jgi:threonylcarbamoyladenosine tRNA methylthiotransferase MtaB